MSGFVHESGVLVPNTPMESFSGFGFGLTLVGLSVASLVVFRVVLKRFEGSPSISGMVLFPFILFQAMIAVLLISTPDEFAQDERPAVLTVMPWVETEKVPAAEPKDVTKTVEDGYGVKVIDAEWEDGGDPTRLKTGESWDVTIQNRGEKVADCSARAFPRDDASKYRVALLCNGTELDKSSQEGSA